MNNYEFIPQNIEFNEEHVELICKTILSNMYSSIYDGRNHYASKVGVCCKDGRYYWGEQERKPQDFLFYPTTKEIEKALDIFKDKGYYPYYDDDVCFYGVVKDKAEIRGKARISHTIWL